MEQMYQYLWHQPPLRIWGLLTVSLPDLEGTGFRACTMEEKINEIYLQLPLFIQNAARIENCVQTVAQTVAQSTNITNIEQIVGSLVARVTSLEENAASGSSSPDSARSWNMLGQSDGSTATGSLGPMAQGRLMTVEIQGVDLRRSQAPKINKHEVPSYYGSRANNTTKGLRSGLIIFGKNPICQHSTNLSEFIVRQVPCRPDWYSKQEPSVQDFVARLKIMASPMKLIVYFAKAEPISSGNGTTSI